MQAARPVDTKLCSDISTSSVASPDSPWQQDNLEEYEQLNLWKSTPTRSPCCERTSQTSPSTQTSETTTQDEESSISLPAAFPAQAQVTPESEKDSSTQTQPCGEKDSAVSVKDDPGLSLWNSLKDLSDEDFAQRLEDSEWQAIAGTLRSSDRQRKSELCTKEPGFLSCPTLNSCSSPSSRPAGQTKCEKWFKDNGLIRTGYQLSASAMAKLMGFPEDWFQALSPSLPTTQDELEPDILPGEPLHLDKRRSPSVESSISTQLLGGDEKCSSNPTPPSTKRRKQGYGAGYIECKPIKRSGKEYKQYWYHYEFWQEGDRLIKSSKYIPKGKLAQVQQLDNQKVPVREILKLLGVRRKNCARLLNRKPTNEVAAGWSNRKSRAKTAWHFIKSVHSDQSSVTSETDN